MAQHFFLSRQAKTPDTGSGVPHVGRRSRDCSEAYPLGRDQRRARVLALRLAGRLRLPPRQRCAALALPDCGKDFSITSGTLFASHKLPLRGYLAAIAIFCNEVKGKSMLALSRDLGLSYKTAFVLAHKLREAMSEEMKGRRIGDDRPEAEVDGADFGGT